MTNHTHHHPIEIRESEHHLLPTAAPATAEAYYLADLLARGDAAGESSPAALRGTTIDAVRYSAEAALFALVRRLWPTTEANAVRTRTQG